MESPIRYMLNNATRDHDEDLIIDLGPLAYALKMIVDNASPHRADSEKKVKFWCFMGMPLMPAQISDISEMLENKKEPKGEINLIGI